MSNLAFIKFFKNIINLVSKYFLIKYLTMLTVDLTISLPPRGSLILAAFALRLRLRYLVIAIDEKISRDTGHRTCPHLFGFVYNLCNSINPVSPNAIRSKTFPAYSSPLLGNLRFCKNNRDASSMEVRQTLSSNFVAFSQPRARFQ